MSFYMFKYEKGGVIVDMIGEIFSLMRKGAEITTELDPIKVNTKSVVKGAKDATFQFPVLVSDSISVDMANTFVRTMDRVYASFTQTWISMHPYMDISVDPTPLSYLKRLHQNMRVESVEEFDDEGELLARDIKEAYAGETIVYMNKDKTRGIVFKGLNPAGKTILESNNRYLKPYLSDFDLLPIYEAESDGTNAYDLASIMVDNKMKEMERRDRSDRMRSSEKSAAPKMVDRDMKKANDIMPFGIQVRLIAKNADNEFVNYIDFVLGVKAVGHLVKSSEMVANIQRALQNKSILFKLIRWTTGEISLMKNVILNIDEIRTDAASRQNGQNPWFSTLKRLKNKKVGIRNFTVPHALIPNATIAISSAEADYLGNNCAVYIRNPRVVKKVMDSLFLVTFAILDDAAGTLDIMYDGSDMFETYALETLERENALNSNKLGREIGRMISH